MRSSIRKFMFCNVVRLSLLHPQNLVLLFKSTLQLAQRFLQLLSKPSTASPVPFICSFSKALYSYSRALNSSKAYAAPENPYLYSKALHSSSRVLYSSSSALYCSYRALHCSYRASTAFPKPSNTLTDNYSLYSSSRAF